MERIWKDAVVDYNLGIFSEEQDLKPENPEYETRVLTTRRQRLVNVITQINDYYIQPLYYTRRQNNWGTTMTRETCTWSPFLSWDLPLYSASSYRLHKQFRKRFSGVTCISVVVLCWRTARNTHKKSCRGCETREGDWLYWGVGGSWMCGLRRRCGCVWCRGFQFRLQTALAS